MNSITALMKIGVVGTLLSGILLQAQDGEDDGDRDAKLKKTRAAAREYATKHLAKLEKDLVQANRSRTARAAAAKARLEVLIEHARHTIQMCTLRDQLDALIDAGPRPQEGEEADAAVERHHQEVLALDRKYMDASKGLSRIRREYSKTFKTPLPSYFYLVTNKGGRP